MENLAKYWGLWNEKKEFSDFWNIVGLINVKLYDKAVGPGKKIQT